MTRSNRSGRSYLLFPHRDGVGGLGRRSSMDSPGRFSVSLTQSLLEVVDSLFPVQGSVPYFREGLGRERKSGLK